MVETKQFYEKDWLDIDFLASRNVQERKATIYSEGELVEFKGKFGNFTRVEIGVEFFGGIQKKWTVNSSCYEKLVKDVRSSNTKDWLGVVLVFSVGTLGKRDVIDVTLVGKKEETLGEVIEG